VTMEHIVDNISSCGGCGPAPGQKPIFAAAFAKWDHGPNGRRPNPWNGGHTLEQLLICQPDGGRTRHYFGRERYLPR